jgi:hypothetical protein
MDADKLELQLAALQQHPEEGLAYSWTLIMDVNRRKFLSGKIIFL